MAPSSVTRMPFMGPCSVTYAFWTDACMVSCSVMHMPCMDACMGSCLATHVCLQRGLLLSHMRRRLHVVGAVAGAPADDLSSVISAWGPSSLLPQHWLRGGAEQCLGVLSSAWGAEQCLGVLSSAWGC